MEGYIVELCTTIGSVLGTPAAVGCFWVFTRLKELSSKVIALEKENYSLKQTLSDIRSDVSYIRGKLES